MLTRVNERVILSSCFTQTNASDHRFDITELKQKAFFGLKKKDYKKVLNRLKSANAVLSTLVHQSNELEGGRRSRARTKHSRLIRKLSKGIFTSFQNVVKCSCSHQLGLRMIARKGLSFPTDDDQLAASRIPFDVGFGSGEENPCQHWNILRVQSTAWDKRLLAVPTTKGVTGSPRSKSPKGVRWLSDLIEQTPKVALPVESQKSYSEIADICGMLRKGKSTALAADHPCGQISYDSTKFNLYQEENWSKDLPPLNLRAMLEGQSNRTSLTNWTGRVQAALALSYGILHLYNTPWLADIVTAEDIVFMREQQRGIEEPFLAKHLSSTTTNANQPRPMHPNGRSMNFVIFSLGLLLIQIMIGRYVHELTIPLDMCMESSIKKKEIATKYICLVVENGGDNYAAVVQWCLGSMFSVACLDDDEFVQDFHHHVIEKLERDLDIVLSRGSLI